MTGTDKLRPGSDTARAAGCTCPVLDNAHGKGYLGQPGTWVMRGGCPLHWPEGQAYPSSEGKLINV